MPPDPALPPAPCGFPPAAGFTGLPPSIGGPTPPAAESVPVPGPPSPQPCATSIDENPKIVSLVRSCTCRRCVNLTSTAIAPEPQCSCFEKTSVSSPLWQCRRLSGEGVKA